MEDKQSISFPELLDWLGKQSEGDPSLNYHIFKAIAEFLNAFENLKNVMQLTDDVLPQSTLTLRL